MDLHPLVPTEKRNPDTTEIDLLSTEEMLYKINQQDAQVALAVEKAIPQITPVVDKITEAFQRGGHLLYFGAGTSGRLGVLDASECPPTFGSEPHQVQAFIAGGDDALRHAIEGAEDSEISGWNDFQAAQSQPLDVVVGISASGRAAYVNGALNAAKSAGCITVALSCNPDALFCKLADYSIVVEVGPEALSGSTRLKAGTAQKLVLNMLTTGAMIQLGKTYENLMVDVQPTNKKLRERARRIVEILGKSEKRTKNLENGEGREITESSSQMALELTGYQVKPAVLMVRFDLSLEEAQNLLDSHQGKLRAAIQSMETEF
ncbi:MAG: N-acetylmuramic acid 6-phosphate etherase [Cyanobacteria bacterium]|nr:N-acetylmuramic acid 6-phosphate etherase [Cyanobacteriota bacterium]